MESHSFDSVNFVPFSLLHNFPCMVSKIKIKCIMMAVVQFRRISGTKINTVALLCMPAVIERVVQIILNCLRIASQTESASLLFLF